jgi:hypothetical protein
MDTFGGCKLKTYEGEPICIHSVLQNENSLAGVNLKIKVEKPKENSLSVIY